MPLRVVVWALLLLSPAALGKDFPLWEAGLGAAVVNLPDYRGADEQRTYVLPIPYVVYRGDKLKVDRQAVRGLLFKSERIELDLSLNASPPVNSDKNRAREGMPDLDPTAEAGPSLKIGLGAGELSGRKSLIVPLRAVMATDFSSLRRVGFVFSPRLNFDWPSSGPDRPWSFSASFGPIFADRKFHDYYYSVDPAYARPGRPAFAARAGYSGSQLILATNRRFERAWFGAFVRFDALDGAVFNDSPLARTRHNVAAGFAVSWVFAVSKTRVEAED